MTLKQIEIETLQTLRNELQRIANRLDATAKLAEENAVELQSNQLGNLKEGLRRVKTFVGDAKKRVKRVIAPPFLRQ